MWRMYHGSARQIGILWFLSIFLLSLLPSFLHGLSTRPISKGKISYIAGQRVQFHPCHSKKQYPPIVLLGGMAQTIASWDHHVAGLSRNRDLLIYECLGQGPSVISEHNNDPYHNVSLPIQAKRLSNTIQEVFPSLAVDIVGFSLGGRVTMAMLADDSIAPTRIRRLHLTGVAANRSPHGHVLLESWKDLLSKGNARGFAWSALMGTYSSNFLHSNQERLPMWIDNVVASNTVKGLHALAQQTCVSSQDPWHTLNMAKRIQSSCNIQKGRLVMGELDVMAPLKEAQVLLEELGWNHSGEQMDVGVFEGCGHAVPMEQPRLWRNDVLSFLDEE